MDEVLKLALEKNPFKLEVKNDKINEAKKNKKTKSKKN